MVKLFKNDHGNVWVAKAPKVVFKKPEVAPEPAPEPEPESVPEPEPELVPEPDLISPKAVKRVLRLYSSKTSCM